MAEPKIIVSCRREEPLNGYQSPDERRENLAQRIASLLWQEVTYCHFSGHAFRSPTESSPNGCSCVPVKPFAVMKRALAILGDKEQVQHDRAFARFEKAIAEWRAGNL